MDYSMTAFRVTIQSFRKYKVKSILYNHTKINVRELSFKIYTSETNRLNYSGIFILS